MPPPTWFQDRFSPLKVSGDTLTQVETAIRALHITPFKGKAIRKDLAATWQLIEKSGRGYCADYSKLFNAMMHAAGVPVREWALGHDDFGRGHTFNEVFDRDLEKWVFVDSFNGMLVRDTVSRTPLSVLEFHDRLVSGKLESIEIEKYTDPTLFFQTRDEALRYYGRSTDYFYLLWGNNVFSYEANSWIQRVSGIARPLERFVAIAIGEYPPIRMLSTETNGAAISKVQVTRWGLIFAALAELLLGGYLLFLILRFWRARRSPTYGTV